MKKGLDKFIKVYRLVRTAATALLSRYFTAAAGAFFLSLSA